MKDDSAPSKFHLSVFGRFQLVTDGGIVRLPSKKLSGLLAHLACGAPQPQAREKLAHLLWGSHFDTQARQNLRQTIFRLRRVLGQDAVFSSNDEVWLAPGTIDCDAVRFKALIAENSAASLAAATKLYRGSFLADLDIEEDAWSDWRATERARLEQLALDAMIRQSRQAMSEGDEKAALKAARRAIQVNVLREDGHRLLLQALVAMGRKAEALKHYQDLVALLKHELGADPDPITQSLVADLRGAAPKGPRKVPAAYSAMSGSSGWEPETDTATARDDGISTIAAAHSNVLEQRLLTILICDLIAPMPLSAGDEPENIYDLVAAFHRLVTDLAERAGGFVAQYQGNGVVVYFGYPSANEHDAERAVRAALAIVRATGKLTTISGDPLRASAGIATGRVVVGESSTVHRSHHHVAIGDPASFATSLQSGAGAGEVLIAETTQRLVGRMFDCEVLPAADKKHPLRSIAAWRVLDEIAGVSRFDARREDNLSPFVGREDEIALLLRRWEQSSRSEGHVVLISGDPGIGKSRVAESVLTRLAGKPHTCLRYSCHPDRTHSPLHPFIAELQQESGFGPDDSGSLKLDKLEASLGPAAIEAPRDVALLADLLDIPLDGRYPDLAANPQQKREMTFNALLDRLRNAASKKPVFILFEDVHWIDPTSLDLLARMVTAIARLPILLLATSRPTFRPDWADEAHVTTLSLSRLTQSDSASIVRSIAQARALPETVAKQILSRADGVPLFIEELTRSLLESRLLREADGDVLDRPLSPRAIPPTLQAALVARLDLLGPAKDVAMVGAAIGREFSQALIGAVSPLSPAALEVGLARLVESGLVARRGTAPECSYVFRHILVQDAAYTTMLRRGRRQLHTHIARTMVEQFPSTFEKQPEIVAHHFTEAGLANEAVGYWIKAARLAQARWANREAAGFFEQAISVLATLPETRETLVQASIFARSEGRACSAWRIRAHRQRPA